MASHSLSSSFRLRQVAIVVVIFATICGAWDAASRRLHRWEHDLLPTSGDCTRSSDVAMKNDKFELISKRPDSNVQLHIRSNLPVSYEADTQDT